MKNNIISSVMWIFIIIASSILLPISLKTDTYLIDLGPLFLFGIIFGVLYYLTNSYIVYRKIQFLKIDVKKNKLLILFPFLIASSKELAKAKFAYNVFFKFLAIIIPLIIAFVISGRLDITIFLDHFASINNRGLARDSYFSSILFSMLYGFGVFLLIVMFLLSILIKLRSTGFFKVEKNIFKNIWRLLLLPFYFPKFYFENLDTAKSQTHAIPVGNFYQGY